MHLLFQQARLSQLFHSNFNFGCGTAAFFLAELKENAYFVLGLYKALPQP